MKNQCDAYESTSYTHSWTVAESDNQRNVLNGMERCFFQLTVKMHMGENLLHEDTQQQYYPLTIVQEYIPFLV